MLKGIYIIKDQKEFLCVVIKNVIWSEKTLMHKAERPSNYFFPILSHILRLSR